MIKVDITIDKVNYEEINEIINKFEKKDVKIINKKMIPKLIAKALDVLPQRMKDGIAVPFVLYKKDDIVTKINNLAEENNIIINVKDISIKNI